MVHDTKTGREIGTVKWVGAYVGRYLQQKADHFLGLDEVAAECERVFTQWRRQRFTDMRERDRDQFVFSCRVGR